MRKIKIGSFLLLLVSVIIFGSYKVYEHVNKDTTPPVITCGTDKITGSVEITEEELLAGVTAKDNESGDVTGSLVIEQISPFTEERTRIITYAAIDAKGNVGRAERVLKYTDYQGPRFTLSEPLRVPMGRTLDLLEVIGAKSVLDGDLSDNIKYTLESSIDVGSPGVYNIEFRVSDSCGYIEYLPIEVEVYDKTEERINVVLSEYLIYVPLNTKFDANRYYVGSDIDGELAVQSNVNTAKPGVYYVDYIVDGNNSLGKSRLVVVVTES